ncbi:MAG: ferrous iron transport protein B [Bacteroidota bacterium]
MTLTELNQDEKAIVLKVKGRGGFRKRILEMGFVYGKVITVVKKAPLNDPVEYEIMGYKVSLRNSEANLIEVFRCSKETKDDVTEYRGTIDEHSTKRQGSSNPMAINVVLVGNPNSGKTTLFNEASGAHEKVGNYSGVTVEAKRSRFRYKKYEINLVDLPGSYSITSYTPEELFIRKYILEEIPDVVVNVIDASNLERNLYLTTQLIDMDIKVVAALNMFDEMQHKGDVFDYEMLGKMIGIPFVPTISSKGKGVDELFDKIIQVYEDKEQSIRHVHINYGQDIEKAIVNIQQKIKIPENIEITTRVSPRFMAIQLLEKDQQENERLQLTSNAADITEVVNREIDKLEKEFKNTTDTLITEAKYGFIAGALLETLKPGENRSFKRSEIIDLIVTHKVFGFPIFFFFMWFMFWATFTIGSYPMNWIESLVQSISSLISSNMQPGMFKDLLVDGIISGVGGVIVFLPNILLLFFFISIMEDTGYMARSVFIMDKVMHKVGLHGKSFIPLLMGFGCNVPAVIATRTLENKNDRLITMLINPFMSCSARLPVYILMISAFFPKNPGLMLLIIYSIGILIAVSASLLMKKTIFRIDHVPFVMELPPYRMPTLKSIVRHMWDKGAQYVKKISGVILLATIVIWALGYFPLNTNLKDEIIRKKEKANVEYLNQIKQTPPGDTALISKIEQLHQNELSAHEVELLSVRLENSYIGKIGKSIQPIMSPLGFDWKMTICVLAGIPAKEVIVSTMNVLYHKNTSSAGYSDQSLEKRLKDSSQGSGMNRRAAFAFMIFVLLYFPCVGTLVAIANESGSWKWSAFSLGYSTLIAWLMAMLMYFISGLFL